MTHYLTVCVKPICHVRTYPEADVFWFLKDLDVYGHDQFVVAASGHSELHLVPKLEGLCWPVVAGHLWLPWDIQVVDSTMVTISEGVGGISSMVFFVFYVYCRELDVGWKLNVL